MSNENNYIGNITTLVKYVSMLIAGWFIGYLVSKGLNLPITTEELSQIISAIIFLLLAHIDATNPNTFFNQKPTETETEIVGEEDGC